MDWFAARGIPRTEADAVILDIPDIRQAEDYDCGSAALDAVARFHGLRKRGPVRLANPVQGMSPDTVEAVLRSLGLRVLSGTMTLPDLQSLTRSGRPVLCPVTTQGGGGHWVVVRGVARRTVYTHCPLFGRLSVRAADWLAGWRDATRAGHEFDRWGIATSRD